MLLRRPRPPVILSAAKDPVAPLGWSGAAAVAKAFGATARAERSRAGPTVILSEAKDPVAPQGWSSASAVARAFGRCQVCARQSLEEGEGMT